MTFPKLFQRTVSEEPETLALVHDGRRVTYRELGARVERVRAALTARGVGRGDRVAVLSHNSIAYVEVLLGTLAAGACTVPLPSMASTQAIELMLADSRAKLVFVSEALRELLEPGHEALSLDFTAHGFTSYEAWLDAAPNTAPPVEVDQHDEFNIIYSSGTTGVPKGIVHDHATRAAFTHGTAAFGFGKGAVTLVSTPIYSNTTLTAFLPSIAFGATSVLMSKFHPREALRLIQAERVTHAMFVPVQYDRMLRVEDFESFDLGSLQMKLCTSAPLRAEDKRRIIASLPGALVEIYGLTEGGVATMLIANLHPDKLDSVGQPVPGCEVRIIDEAGSELGVGQAGEVVGRGSFMMKHYENRPDATDEMIWRDAQGRVFYRSGDIGRLDEQGFLYLLDRKKDVIISGGLNIFASDLEAVLLEHPAVREAAVVGVPSERWGETPLGVVVVEPMAPSAAELLEWANARLGKSQRLSAVEIVDELPKSAIGKVLKRELRARFV
jgi:acyl-CoA synthetase (AMP-forming)/AMP-acid ligase II